MDVSAGLTVVTWNAQGSRGLDIAAAARALTEFEPQLVFLQEVQRRQVGALRRAMHATDARWRFKHWSLKVPAEGLGILSMIPLRDVTSHVLAHRWAVLNWRRRIAMSAGVTVDVRVVRCVNVHLGAGVPIPERVRQGQSVLDLAGTAKVIAGDLNAGPESAELHEFASHGWCDAEARAHPNGRRPATNWRAGPRVEAPTQRLDYLLIRDAVGVTDAFVPTDWERWAPLSDHLPVVARLRL